MSSNDIRIVILFPPAEDEVEKDHRQKLKHQYKEMHTVFKRGLFVSLEEFLATFDTRNDGECMHILRDKLMRPCVLHCRHLA